MKRLLLALLVLFSPTLAGATSYYVSQSGGTVSCGSLGTQSTQSVTLINGGGLSAGDFVYLCGTISSNLTLANSGTSEGARITIDGTGATIGTSNYIVVTSRNYITLQNITAPNSTAWPIIQGYGSGYITIDNLTADGANKGVINLKSRSHDIIIRNSYIRSSTTTLNTTNDENDLIVTGNSYNIIVEGNYIESRFRNLTDTTDGAPHHDMYQIYAEGGICTSNCPSNITFRYNEFVLNTTSLWQRSWIMTSSLEGTIQIYGNLFIQLDGGESGNGLNIGRNVNPVNIYAYNNTFVRKTGGIYSYRAENVSSSGATYFRNNIMYSVSVSEPISATGSGSFTHDHNIYYGGGTYLGTTCSSYIGASESCTNPLFSNYSNNDFRITSAPAKDSGSSFGSPYDTTLSSESITFPDPALIGCIGSCDIGAFELVSGDSTPDQFTFTDVTNASLSTQYTSDSITVLGINAPSPISISGNSGQYSVNGSTFISTSGTVSVNDTVRVRQTSSSSRSTSVTTTLNIGGVTDDYIVTTYAPRAPMILWVE